MATRIAWLLNLDAELELQQGKRYQRDAALDARIVELLPRLGALVGAEDKVVGRDPNLDEADTACAFCPTPSALQRLRAAGLSPAISTPEPLLRWLARRAFSASLGQTLPGAAYVENLDDLVRVLAQPPRASRTGWWVLKRDFSFAGRGQLRARSLDEHGARGFAERVFARGEGLQVEPWCDRLLDVAQHAFLRADGRLLVGSPRIQRCDARGVWQESEDADERLEHLERHALQEAVSETGQALRELGYHGPFGLDGFRYEAPDGVSFRARCEVNARFTMAYPRALAVSGLARASCP